MLLFKGNWCESVLYILDQIGSAAYVNMRIPESAENVGRKLYMDCVYSWSMKS